MTTTGVLTKREREALEQMREAQKQGVTLKAYAAKMGLDVGQLYEIRRRLVRKGAFGALPPRKCRFSSLGPTGQYRFIIQREVSEAGLTFQEAITVFRGDSARTLS